MDAQTSRLTAEVEAAILKIEEECLKEEKHRQKVLATPLKKIATDYLDWIFKYAEFDRKDTHSDQHKDAIAICLGHINARADDLAIHGYSGAGTPELFYGRQGIIPRILSIKTGRGVGYRLDSTMAVMNAIRQSRDQNRSNHSIYLIAEKVFRSELQPVAAWYEGWANEVRASIKSSDPDYLREGNYDKLLSMLFPEMAISLANGFGTSRWRPKIHPTSQKPTINNATAILTSKLMDTSSDDGWLKGRDLDNWNRSYPDAAKNFKNSREPKG